MMKRYFLLLLLIFSTSYPKASIGLRLGAGFDWTLSSKNTSGLGDPVTIDNLTIIVNEIPITIQPNEVPIFVSRSNWKRVLLSLNTSFYWDKKLAPFIDRVEVSTTLSFWEYNGLIWFADSVRPDRSITELLSDPSNTDNYFMRKEPITLESRDVQFFGMSKTPYAKIHFDLVLYTLLPYFSQNSPLSIYTGGGFALTFSTPMLSSQFVQAAIKDKIGNSINLQDIKQQFSEKDISRYILKRVTDQLSSPSGALCAALLVELRSQKSPIALSTHLKYLIPVQSINPDLYLGGYGFELISGLTLFF